MIKVKMGAKMESFFLQNHLFKYYKTVPTG